MQYQIGMEANAVYFPQLGHLAVLTGRNLAYPIPEHINWELFVSSSSESMPDGLVPNGGYALLQDARDA